MKTTPHILLSCLCMVVSGCIWISGEEFDATQALAMDVDQDGYDSVEWGGDDCDDNDANTYPGAAALDSVSTCMTDADDDGWGDDNPVSGVNAGTDCDDADSTLNMDDADDDGAGTCDDDCDDDDANTYPGAATSESETECMTDADGDGWGETNPDDGITAGTDCDDSDSELNNDDADADSSTTCDGDCNDDDENTYPGAAASDSTTACTTDVDGDGWGETSPASGVTAGTDCDDSDSELNNDDADVDSASTCDGDCDDNDYTLNLQDLDNDGVTTCDDDCDDNAADTFPGAAENESSADTGSAENLACMTDADLDGWGDPDPDNGVTAGTDCDDTDDDLNQDDQDGDLITSCDDDCNDEDANTFPGSAELDSETSCMTDADGDGFGDDDATGFANDGTDCDDDDGTIYPGAVEESDSDECMMDADEDGYGDMSPADGFDAGTDCDDDDATLTSADDDGDGYSTCDDDCDDDDEFTFPGAAENETSEDTGSTADQWCMTDADDDGWGDASPAASDAIEGTDCDDTDAALNNDDADGDDFNTCEDDCDDDDAFTFPGAAEYETADDGDTGGSDTGTTDTGTSTSSTCMTDADEDGWGDDDPEDGVSAGSDCDDSDDTLSGDDLDEDGYSTCDEDCDDNDDTLSPAEMETFADSIDSDCDGGVDTFRWTTFDTHDGVDVLGPRLVFIDDGGDGTIHAGWISEKCTDPDDETTGYDCLHLSSFNASNIGEGTTEELLHYETSDTNVMDPTMDFVANATHAAWARTYTDMGSRTIAVDAVEFSGSASTVNQYTESVSYTNNEHTMLQMGLSDLGNVTVVGCGGDGVDGYRTGISAIAAGSVTTSYSFAEDKLTHTACEYDDLNYFMHLFEQTVWAMYQVGSSSLSFYGDSNSAAYDIVDAEFSRVNDYSTRVMSNNDSMYKIYIQAVDLNTNATVQAWFKPSDDVADVDVAISSNGVSYVCNVSSAGDLWLYKTDLFTALLITETALRTELGTIEDCAVTVSEDGLMMMTARSGDEVFWGQMQME